MPPLDPDVANLAPSDPVLTVYDKVHAVTYMRMLDADAARRRKGCGTASRARQKCQPRTMNSSTAVTISSAQPIGGTKVAMLAAANGKLSVM